MVKKVFLNFLKDKFSVTLVFLINSFLLILFFKLSTGKNIEIIYPATLSLFIYIIYITFEWFKYFKYNYYISKCIDNVNFKLDTSTYEQSETLKIINKIHDYYNHKLSLLESQSKQNKYFISQWIHNMKTPVSVIDLILQKPISDKYDVDKMRLDIKEENIRMLNCLEQVLSLLRLNEFSRDYTPQVLDLITSVKKVINKKKSLFIYNNVFPKICSEHDHLPVLSDAKWNDTILDQIVSNAIKYSSVAGKNKTVYFIFEKINDRVLLTIKDEGIGIPEYDVKRVFEPFFTGENGRFHQSATGIGLFICKQIADKLGHDLSIQSVSGEGTSLTISYLSKV